MSKDEEYLEFDCKISNGMGMYSELEFPEHPLWPEKMHSGSLNASIKSNGFPAELETLGQNGHGVQKLDNGRFSSLFNIAQKDIGNNSLTPTRENPERGTAQVWACQVEVEGTTKAFNAWAVRRIGSAYYNVLELMSDKHLRDTYSLENGMSVKIKLFKGDQANQQLTKGQNNGGWRHALKKLLG